MFGMEKPHQKKKKDVPVFLFDIEKELQNTSKQHEYAQRIQERVMRIKELLRKGSKKEDYDHLGVLLNAYHALAVVLGRVSQQAGRKKK